MLKLTVQKVIKSAIHCGGFHVTGFGFATWEEWEEAALLSFDYLLSDQFIEIMNQISLEPFHVGVVCLVQSLDGSEEDLIGGVVACVFVHFVLIGSA